MGSGLYSTKKQDIDTTLDLTRLKPYGDTMNDGKVQLSFTLPVPDSEVAVEAAKQLATKMGLVEPMVAHHAPLDKNFSFFVIYGSLSHIIDYTHIHVDSVDVNVMTMEETDQFIQENFGRKLRVIGASTGTDAHTVGIDAIMNMKGYAGHFGLERYKMIEALNLGSQVSNEDFIRKAVEFNADVLLVSQTVTQKNVHVQNLTELVELLEAERLRSRFLLVIGGPRITHELAKELGCDAGFGPGKYADDVASFICEELAAREQQ
jgi:beta-lysine 5,6-aminomutase beta subunit